MSHVSERIGPMFVRTEEGILRRWRSQALPASKASLFAGGGGAQRGLPRGGAGKNATGKSSTGNSLLNESPFVVSPFQQNPGMPVNVVKKYKSFQLRLIDTPSLVEGDQVSERVRPPPSPPPADNRGALSVLVACILSPPSQAVATEQCLIIGAGGGGGGT